jgi:hypothetical protein
MSNKITLPNFLKMSPDAPQFTQANQHYLLSGVNPTYYNDVGGIQEEQIAPLIASNIWTRKFENIISGNKIADVTSNTTTIGAALVAYSIDTNSRVQGFNFTPGLTPAFSYPSGGVEVSTMAKVCCFNSYLLAVTNGSTSSVIYKMALPGVTNTGPWTTCTGSIAPVDEDHFLEPFLEYCMISNSYSKITPIDSSFTLLTASGIDLGSGWVIKGMRNYNDKYLAIAGAQGVFDNNYLFLWDGRSSRYNYSVKMSGKFIDMKVIDGTLYVAIQELGTGSATSSKTTIYYLKGYQLVPLFTPQISPIIIQTPNNAAQSSFKMSLFNLNNRLGVMLNSTDLLLYGNSPVGKEEFVISTGFNFYKFVETSNGMLIAIAPDAPPNAIVQIGYFYNYSSTTFNNISYKSHWIPVKNLSGIDVYYDTPPQSGTDAINVTLYGHGEDIVTGNSTQVLQSITPITILNTSRTRLDVAGFTGDLAKIELSTVNSTWRPNIRKIELITE